MMGWGVLIFMLGIASTAMGAIALWQGDVRAAALLLAGIAMIFLAPRLDARGMRDEE